MAVEEHSHCVRSLTLDLDGTLLDTIPDLAAAANATLAELGLPGLGEADVAARVGLGIDQLVARCLSAVEADAPGASGRLTEALPRFRAHYAACNGRGTHVYPGVIDTLAALEARGFRLACVTNKAAAFTLPLLARTGLARFFGTVIAGDTLAEKKPHPLPLLEACVRLGTSAPDNAHVGDSHHDLAAARAAGCVAICVDYGYGPPVDARECDALVSAFPEILALVRPAR